MRARYSLPRGIAGPPLSPPPQPPPGTVPIQWLRSESAAAQAQTEPSSTAPRTTARTPLPSGNVPSGNRAQLQVRRTPEPGPAPENRYSSACEPIIDPPAPQAPESLIGGVTRDDPHAQLLIPRNLAAIHSAEPRIAVP